MARKYDIHYFDVSDLCTAPSSNPARVERFRDALRDLAERLDRVLPEYRVKAEIWPFDSKLRFSWVDPEKEE